MKTNKKKTKKVEKEEVREISIFTNIVGIELTTQWSEELPAVGDIIDLPYFFEEHEYKKFQKTIIQDSDDLTDVEKKFIGKSLADMLEGSTATVTLRSWPSKACGCLITCTLS